MNGTCKIVELRRYALHPGARETLIALFDREFIETQEAVGMRILGQFRDLDDPDSFVWLRGFSDMRARKRALESFYGGPVWKEHARAANATMIDSDDVLLLAPLSGLEIDADERPEPGSKATPPGLLVVTIYSLVQSAAGDFPDFFVRELEPALSQIGSPYWLPMSRNTARTRIPRCPSVTMRTCSSGCRCSRMSLTTHGVWPSWNSRRSGVTSFHRPLLATSTGHREPPG